MDRLKTLASHVGVFAEKAHPNEKDILNSKCLEFISDLVTVFETEIDQVRGYWFSSAYRFNIAVVLKALCEAQNVSDGLRIESTSASVISREHAIGS